jgi:hypothetical protein
MGNGYGLTVIVFLATIRYGGPPPTGADGPDRRPIPDPPRQGAVWTPPETRLPRFLVAATEALFAQGVADPRGCDYREVTLAPARGTWRGTKPAAIHAFVLPAIEGDDRRFAVDWDGLVSRIQDIGPEVDLAAGVRGWVKALSEGRKEADQSRSRGPSNWFWRNGPSRQGSRTESIAPLRVCLLLRLDRADLAEALFAAATPWTAAGPRPDLTDYGVGYLTLANDWANDLYVRGVDAHGRGDDGLALDAFRRIAAFRKQVEAMAAAMGFPPARARGPQGTKPTYFRGLSQLDELLADQERRTSEPPRGPIPGREADLAARVAALILNLDEVAEHQMSIPGGAHPGSSPLVRELITIGATAVEPLLHALVHDHRLTRSIAYGRMLPQDRFVSPTINAIIPAVDGLMKASVPGITSDMRYRPDEAKRRALAAAYRKYWEANRAVPLAERYYRILADDAAGDRWLEAARALTVPTLDASGRPRYVPPGQPPLAALGEPLRQARDPSITALMIRRTEDLARRATSPIDLRDAFEMAAKLAEWELPASLPVLRAMMDRDRNEFARDLPQDNWTRPALARTLARFTLLRSRAGDRAALDEYAAWIFLTSPEQLEEGRREAFEPMWVEAQHPAIAAAAGEMFAPGTPWARSLSELSLRRDPFSRHALEISPLIRVSAFRRAVVAGLADRAEAGTVERRSDQPQVLSFTLKGGSQSGQIGAGTMTDLDELPLGEKRVARACDWLALRLASLNGAPRFELYWTSPRRDDAIVALAVFLERYGDRFEPDEHAGPGSFNLRLAFPRLGRPATAADREAGRAIFSLEGEGDEIRVVPLPEVPLRAVWTTLKDTPLTYQTYSPDGGSQTHHDFDRSGRVWQAEEVRVGDRWKRYFGFVGTHTVGRAPAEEIRFYAGPYDSRPPEGRFGVQLTLADPPISFEEGLRPGAPVVVAVHLANRTGLDQAAPTEFVRVGPDGKPVLRPGISLKLLRSAISPAIPLRGEDSTSQPEELRPTRDARFAPGDATRTLGPAQAFEAFRLDLRDWFDLSRPGQYHLLLTFGEASGIGTDISAELYFRSGE